MNNQNQNLLQMHQGIQLNITWRTFFYETLHGELGKPPLLIQ